MKITYWKNIAFGLLALMATDAMAQQMMRKPRKVLRIAVNDSLTSPSDSMGLMEPDSVITILPDSTRTDVLFRSFKKRAAQSALTRSAGNDEAYTVLVECENADELIAYLSDYGLYAVALDEGKVAVTITAEYIGILEARSDIKRIKGSRMFKPRMMKSLAYTHMDKVYTGEGLETPFTGKDVIVAVIDQGFEFNHPAFCLSGGKETRVKRLWNRYSNKNLLTQASDIQAQTHDNTGESHATHVSGIAAGSAYSTRFRGNAPEADLVFIPSTFGDNELLQDVNYIKAYADSVGKPAVINFSVGSQVGTHSGEGENNVLMDKMLGKGLIFCQAAGNEGDYYLHASKKLTSDTDCMKVMVDCQDNEAVLYFMAENPAGRSMQISFSVYNINTGKTKTISSNNLRRYFSYGAYEASYTGRPDIYVEVESCSAFMNINSEVLVVSVGLEQGATVHGWVANPGYGEFLADASSITGYTSGDNLYNINPEAKHSLQIAAFDNCNTFKNYSGQTVQASYFTPGDLAYYSNSGPVVGEWLPMPLVAAPGSFVTSSISKYESGFSASDETIMYRQTSNSKSYYYAMMSGTSMSTPQVTGILACWMQAYPQLNAEEATEIIAQTAINDEFTGNIRDKWDLRWGYGKIDAYEGLKECLRRASAGNGNGINDTRQTLAPITLCKEPASWKVLFNSDEPYADFRLTTLDGKEVFARHLTSVSCAQEEKIDFSSCPSGVYLLTVRTINCTETKKFVK
ncbi:MAG: S8 family peptidase [Clostridium sp.]|nr:S8 family peptidase [Clostridium sp.]